MGHALLSRGGGVGGRDTAEGVGAVSCLLIWIFLCTGERGGPFSLRSLFMGVADTATDSTASGGPDSLDDGDALNFFRFRETVDWLIDLPNSVLNHSASSLYRWSLR